MLYEYAIEPELVATWSDRKVGRYFADKFGLGSPRIVSRYPKRWKKLVWSAWEQLHGGVSFGVGLDEAEAADGATDDLHLLDRNQYEARWRQYSDESLAFASENPISITGARSE